MNKMNGSTHISNIERELETKVLSRYHQYHSDDNVFVDILKLPKNRKKHC